MAAIRKRGNSWRVQIRRRNHPPQFKAFKTRAEAEAWARQIESEMDRGAFVSRAKAERTPIADLLDRYEREITPGKRSARAEIYRLKMLKDALGRMPIARLPGNLLSETGTFWEPWTFNLREPLHSEDLLGTEVISLFKSMNYRNRGLYQNLLGFFIFPFR